MLPLGAFPNKVPRTARAERMAGLLKIDPDTLVTRHADNYHRGFGTDWSFIEPCGAAHKDWSADAEARLNRFVRRGHSLGYMVGVCGINGWTEGENQGWKPEYNFGSKEASAVRLRAIVKGKGRFHLDRSIRRGRQGHPLIAVILSMLASSR